MSNFSELYPTMRVLLGDLNEAMPGYSNPQLDMGISAALLQDDTYEEGSRNVSGGGRTITPTLADKKAKLLVSVRASICLLSPNRGPFSYGTRVLRVSRNLTDHLAYLEDIERSTDNNSLALDSQTEWDQFVRGVSNVTAKLGEMSGLDTDLE